MLSTRCLALAPAVRAARIGPSRVRRRSRWLLALAALLAAGPVAAQFKVVEPGGRVTYTDRPPSYQTVPDARGGTALTAGLAGQAAQADAAGRLAAGLPYALRQVVLRYPVRLLVADACAPCESARRLLRERGVPMQEVSVNRPEDVEQLQREFGTRELPVLLVGRERHVGYAEGLWSSTLDAAGYPAVSALPAGYRPPAPQPLAAAPASAEAPRGERTESGAPVVSPLPAVGIRF